MSEDLLRLAELADRCEIERAGRELDADISMALFPWIARGEDGRFYRRDGGPYDGVPVRILHYTTSLDDAMTLVPEGYCVSAMGEVPDDCDWYCCLWGEHESEGEPERRAKTLPLAIVSAALRARASIVKGEGK